MNVPRSIRKPRKTSSLLRQVKARYNSYEYFSFSQSRKTSSLLHQVKARYDSYEYSSFYMPTMQTNFAFTPSKNVLIIIMNIPRSISQPHKTSSLLHQVKTR